MIQQLADGAELDIRGWSAVSHVVALMYGQITGCGSLNGIVDAAHHDSKRAWTLCEGVKPGDCVIADRAYTDFGFMFRLDEREAFFVVREKTNMRFTVLEKRAVVRAGKDAKVQIHDFVGYNENAVKWQVWTGMLVHLLLRFMKHLSQWGLSFSRLVGIVRAAVWVKRDLLEILGIYGTA